MEKESRSLSGRLLKARGYRVTMQKFDPYINIDPGTMNPVQHGEVFVTDDGAETDLDLGTTSASSTNRSPEIPTSPPEKSTGPSSSGSGAGITAAARSR